MVEIDLNANLSQPGVLKWRFVRYQMNYFMPL